ncbi:MAG: hypothetical protein QGI83_01355 [Candidatus Latescibacteria bacterium]|nr:hypothetical protein [Candidatus Latescibacterota bacterium]
MTFNLINRRTHLYLAMFLLPWFIVYGISAVPFTRNAYFNNLYKDGTPQWTVRFEREYHIDIPDDADLRAIGAQILRDVDIVGPFGTYRPNKARLNIYLVDFWEGVRLTYYIRKGRLKVEDKRFRWDQFFTGLHARGGYQHDGLLNDAWAYIVDLVCVSILVWIASGLYMWWKLSSTRRWGAVALSGGILSFVVFLVAL